ncbi:hypothetical protein EJ04DRAFT_168876 [Polyplosphaeria fusca]|uniref:Rhodanese domain-containing protein n=1 Tax=Polyplosphaeria fusca TaxID=682080 RepID=A0A9P4RCN2_9PLEO|nr:hypothetical protein EJ04DRAFT_168876 [Polyplosphaeria fusca]
MEEQKRFLVDVRTPAEFSTGAHGDALNLEFQNIDQLPLVLAEKGIELQKIDAITLYCRSGRRSDIALQTLKGLGYQNVRDIGGFEEALATLKREEAAEISLEVKSSMASMGMKDDGKVHSRKTSLAALMKGLEDCEDNSAQRP